MDHVIRRIGDPDFGFPSDGGMKSCEGFAIWKRRHEDQSRANISKKFRQFVFSFLINRPMTRHSFYNNDPIPSRMIYQNIGRFASLRKRKPQLCHGSQIGYDFLVGGITKKKNFRPTHKALGEFFHDPLDQLIRPSAARWPITS